MIRNPEIIKEKFKCNKILGQYLQSHGVPLLAIDKSLSGQRECYYFRKTEMLKEAIQKAPWPIKLLSWKYIKDFSF